MKYDIHKFEQLHFLCTQIEKSGATWNVGTTALDISQVVSEHKYHALITLMENEESETTYAMSADCPVDALALAYQKLKESHNETKPEPALDRAD